MGVYSWVPHICSCGGEVQFQTKSGPIEYGTYDINAVPIDVANRLSGSLSSCDDCGKDWCIEIAPRDYETLPMRVVEL